MMCSAAWRAVMAQDFGCERDVKADCRSRSRNRREKVSYSREIAELLEDKCTGCHGSVLAEKRLSLESVAAMLKGGKSGPAIVRGKADESLMFKMAAHRVSPVMPPKDKPANKPMTSLELGLLQMWINQGPATTLTKSELPERGPTIDRAGRTAVRACSRSMRST